MNDTTHYAECWREPGHQACAVAEVVRLRDVLYERSSDPVWRPIALRYAFNRTKANAAVDLAMEGTQAP